MAADPFAPQGETAKLQRIVLVAAAALLTLGVATGTHPSVAAGATPAADVVANPADGVLNQGDRTLPFDHGWKFKLVNTADTTDPTGLYGNSSNPLAAAPGSTLVVAIGDAAARLGHRATADADRTQRRLLSRRAGLISQGLHIAASDAGKRISVDFDGVYMNSYVYLNGALLGNHPYGYTGFSFDVTDKVHTNGVTPQVQTPDGMRPGPRDPSGNEQLRHIKR